jgi:antitoxin component YwqK of YwqJK toxin-antitoxin module
MIRAAGLVSLLCICSSTFAQQKKTSYCPKKPDQVREVFEYKIVNGDTIKEGLYQIFYENGNLWQEGQFKANQLIGKRVDNHPNLLLRS